MSEFLSQAKEQFLVWRMAILIGVLFSINALCTSITATLVGGAKWETMDGQSKFLIIIMVISNWTGVMIAFLNKTVSKISEGKLPFDETQQFTKKDTKNEIKP